MSYPTDRRYTKDHEWITSNPARVGITQFAATALDEAVYVNLPEVGSEIEVDQPCGEIESVKSVSDLVAPVSGTVTAINDEAEAEPKLITDNPHEVWLYEVEISDEGALMDAEEYERFIGES